MELEGRLAEAHAAVLARDEARKRAARELPAGKPRAQAGWVAAASTAWLVVALALLSPPAILRGGVAQPFAPAEEQAESSMRYGIWLAEQRVSTFLQREGRLPSFLGEAGMQDSTIHFEITGERTYRLRAEVGAREIVFVSGMPVDAFLGSSLEQLRSRP